jgi:hypothetical protein
MNLSNLAFRGWIAAALLSAGLVSHAMAQSYGPYNSGGAYGGNASPQQADPREPANPQQPAWNTGRDGYPVMQTQALQPPENQQGQLPQNQRGQGPVQVADRSAAPPSRPNLSAQPNEHPLMPAIRWGYAALRVMDGIQDYSATLCKRERLNGKVGETEYAFIKVRNKPFSVYMYFMEPSSLRGQEVVYVEGQNNGKLLGHGSGFRKVFGTVPLEPTSPFAMRGQHYPITELGITNLIRRLIEVSEKDAKYGECEVNFFQGAKINNRVCTCIQVVHPVPRRNFIYHMARIFVDDELNIPIRLEAYDWPERRNSQPQLIEEYTYVNLKLNNGFTDADFDIRNPNYGFKTAVQQQPLPRQPLR